MKQLAKLSGVSSRTLHFYDEIGLLKPAFIGENKYRYYEKEQLLILQQILFYRELGFSLNDIKTILSAKDFDKLEALKSHKKVLQQNLSQTQQLIKTIDKTIAHLRGEIKMRDEEFFDPMRLRQSPEQQNYEQYLMEGGILSKDELDKSWDKIKHWNKSDWDNYKQQGDAIYKEMVIVMHEKLPPSSAKAQDLIRKHYQLIKPFWTFDKTSFIGLANMYREHPDFGKFFDCYDPQLLEYVVKAMKIFAERELS